jgi:hypothetical protein
MPALPEPPSSKAELYRRRAMAWVSPCLEHGVCQSHGTCYKILILIKKMYWTPGAAENADQCAPPGMQQENVAEDGTHKKNY